MEQNNFEKNVQHKLDELKIPPSDSVWTNVEKQIGKKEKDRRIIFMLFFILILLTGGFWFLNSPENNPYENKQISSIKTKDAGKATPPGSISGAVNKQDSSFQKTKKIAGINQGNTYLKGFTQNNIKRFRPYSENHTGNKNIQKQINFIKQSLIKPNNNYSREAIKADSEISLDFENELNEKEYDIAEIKSKNESENIESSLQNRMSIDRFSKELKVQKTTRKLIKKTDTSAKKTSEKQSWILGITLSGGTSSIGNNSLGRNYPLADMNAGAPQGGGAYYYYTPSAIKNSAAFTAGILLEKNLSPKTKISLGISYRYYSLVNKVGNKIDSILPAPSQYFYSSNNYYTSVNSLHSYRNNFHYLELPVSVKFQLNKNKRLPLFWNAGINISQLISSNALQFQSNPGLYYNDNSLINKTQFGLSTGLSATFFSKGKRAFNIGPYFYYGATKLANKGLYNKAHFTFIGLRTEILFQKK